MGIAQRSWVSCSIIAGAAITAWALSAQLSAVSGSHPTDIVKPTALQTELLSLEYALGQWIDNRDPSARRQSLSSTIELRRMVREDGSVEAADISIQSMLASLQAGLRTLSIQDRLIHMAQQEVLRSETDEANARLEKATQRRAEIIATMIEPAISLIGGTLIPSPTDTPNPEKSRDRLLRWVGI